jgi:hypothetical protein
MDHNSKIIQEWQNKLKHNFDDQAKLLEYLLNTLDNFLYRYLETTESKNLKSFEIAPYIFGGESFESSMVEALKLAHPVAHAGIMALAKSIPKAQKPMVKYRLQIEVSKLRPENGQVSITAIISWDFPLFMDGDKSAHKTVHFSYQDVGQFRKELAIKLEECCELFT